MKKIVILLFVILLAVLACGGYSLFNLNRKNKDFEIKNINLNAELDSYKNEYTELFKKSENQRKLMESQSYYCIENTLKHSLAEEFDFKDIFSKNELKDILSNGLVRQICKEKYGKTYFVIGGKFDGFNTVIGQYGYFEGDIELQLTKFTFPTLFPEDGGDCRVLGQISNGLLYQCILADGAGATHRVGIIDYKGKNLILQDCETYANEGVKCKINKL